MKNAIKTGVIGHPVAHSKSPLIHNYWIEKYGLAGAYTAIDITEDALEAKISALIDQAYAGFNVTVPHKEKIISLCAGIDETARKIGAVNTVSIHEGKLYGTNTDMFGFVENLRENAPGFDFSAGPAVVLGAGGAARAVLHGLLQEGVPEIYLLNRTRGKAENLAAIDPCIHVHDWIEIPKILDNANFIVNTTSLGMAGKEPLKIDLSYLPKTALVHDIVYAPLQTGFLKLAQARGNQVVTGIGMLLHQAQPAFEKWHGIRPDVDRQLQEMVLR